MDRLLEFAQQNLVLSLALAGITVALIVTEIRHLFRGYKGVSPAQLVELVNRENALVLDLRGLGDFEKGHITGSRHLLPSEVTPAHKLLAKAQDGPVVLVCAAGISAQGVAEKLVKAGFKKVSVLEGGIGAWTAASLPLAKGKA